MIYLDSAATSLQKPAAVKRAVGRAVRQCASPGRGVYPSAMRAAEIVFQCREEAAALFHMDSPDHVVFTQNATHALNIAVHSVVVPGMRVAVSGYEHNAVIRPLVARGAEIRVASAPLFDREGMIDAFRRVLPGAGAAVCTHVSNVFGFRLPLREIAALCREEGVPLIVDASQSAGVMDIDFPGLGAVFCAMPGHKGLLGPQGTGLLLCRDSAEPLLYGGTGSQSERPDMPEDLPDRLEAGTLNVCGVAGLLEGIRYIRRNGTEKLAEREAVCLTLLMDGLARIPWLRVFSNGTEQIGAVSMIPADGNCEALAEKLAERGVAVRAGLHCAPLAHTTAGTLSTGTLRMSVSPFTSAGKIRKTLSRLEKFKN